tara:strand:+ start:478 stop:1248 length:771 start_codon:yes stop_codon:yes gene_type:complete
MRYTFDSSSLEIHREALVSHPVFRSVTTLPRLRVFMEHHVYPVWDFMSLLKDLQYKFAPHGSPWLPHGNGDIRRFVNEIVTEEESDKALSGSETEYISHFDLYRKSMSEIGADTAVINNFISCVAIDGLAKSLKNCELPDPARQFMQSTFDMIAGNQPHCVAASFALGREDIVPKMFKSLLGDIKISEKEAPTFHYYLNRHTEIDEESHGPLAVRMLSCLCDGDSQRLEESIEAARISLQARIVFWDGVHNAISKI